MTSFANAAALLADAFADFVPPDRVSVADWAAQHRWLDNAGGGHVGRWDNSIAPYLIEPMEALTSPLYNAVAIAGPGQCGKTEIANNWLLQSVDTDPASFLRFMQTEDATKSYVKDKINPMLEAHPRIQAKLGPRPIDDSIAFKRFRGMSVQFLAAVRSSLISKSAPRIVCDEVDAYDTSLGDVKNLIDVRRQTFGRDSMACLISHPDRAGGSDPSKWNAGVMALYADSTRCTWWWACPECGAYSSPNPGTARHMVLVYPEHAPLDRVAAETRLLCPSNGCLLEDSQRGAMLRTGQWLGQGQTITEAGELEGARLPRDIAGYWIVGVMSPFLLNGIGGLAAARVKAQRALDAGEDDRSLREVLCKQWGIPYDNPRRVGSLDAVALADRAEPELELGVVPEGVRFITAAADVQGNRFEGLVRGWGVGGESWVLDHWVQVADVTTSGADWDDMVARLLRPLPLADGSGRVMAVHAAGYDSGGKAGVTVQAYDAWTRAKGRRVARLRGKVDGRDAWTLLPLKGASTPNAARLSVVYPDMSGRKDRFGGARGNVPLGQFNPNSFKDDLAVQLATHDGAWSVHVPGALRGDHLAVPRTAAPPHRFFEQMVAEQRTKGGRWEKPAGVRNEATDLMAMAHIVAHLHGLARLKWEAPRAWFAPWDSNSGVFLPGAEPVAASAAPVAVAPVVAAPVASPDPITLPPSSVTITTARRAGSRSARMA